MDSLIADCNEVIKVIFATKFNRDHPLEVYDVAILSLYSALTDKYKTVRLLQEQRVTTEVNLIERGFIEQYVYLLFILEKHIQERGRAYFINQRNESYRQTKRLLKYLSDKDQVRSLKVSLDRIIEEDNSNRQTFEEAAVYFDNKFEALFTDGFNRNALRRRKGMKVLADKRVRRVWYNIGVDGTNTFKDLCVKLDLSDLYYGFYGPLSMDVHGVDAPANLTYDRIIDPSKNIANVVLKAGYDEQNTVNLLRAFIIQITLKVCHHYGINRNKIPNQMMLKQKIRILSQSHY